MFFCGFFIKLIDLCDTRDYRIVAFNLVFITQRIQEFPPVLWEQCKLTYLFKITHPTTLRYVENFIPEIKELNPQLQQHDVLEYNHVTGELRIICSYEIVRRTKHYG